MFEIILSALLGFVVFVEILILFDRSVNLRSLCWSFGYLALLTTIAATNFELEIFEQKFASEFPFDVFKQRESLRNNSTFILQAIVSSLAFLITDVWWAAIGTNVALTAAVFYFVHSRKPRLSLIMLAPAIVNFCMFSLRDPVISALSLAVTWFLLAPPSTGQWFKQGFSILLFSLIRPENIAIFGYAKLMTVIGRYSRSFLLYLSFPLLIVIGIAVAAFIPQMLGMETKSASQLPAAANEFYEARATRHDDAEGGGSDILGGALDTQPIVVRYPIQVLTFFVLPLPFEIRNMAMALAFLDSLIFMAITYVFHKHSSREAIIIFWVFVLAVAFFSSNYGNVFRLRLPAYYVMLAGLLRGSTSYNFLRQDPQPGIT